MSNHFEFVSKQAVKPVKQDMLSLLNEVRQELPGWLTFHHEWVGSAPLNMITWAPRTNVGFDLDLNLVLSKKAQSHAPKEIKDTFMKHFNRCVQKHGYSPCEDSSRVITIKVVDRKHSRIIHSCDLAIVREDEDEDGRWHQEFIRFDKKQKNYRWERQPDRFYTLQDKTEWLKDNNCWNEVRDLYLKKKNANTDPRKKSRALRAEAIHEVCQRNGYFTDEEDVPYHSSDIVRLKPSDSRNSVCNQELSNRGYSTLTVPDSNHSIRTILK